MRKILKYISIIGTVISLSFFIVEAGTYIFPYQGGTGTSTPPTVGQLLVGTSGGVYITTTTFPIDIKIDANASTTGAHSIGELSVNNAYWFPITAGNVNEILKTDANGILTWQIDGGGGGGGGALGWSYSDESQLLTRSTTTDQTLIGGSATTSATAIFEVIGESVFDLAEFSRTVTTSDGFFSSASSSVQGNFRVDGNTTSTGSFVSKQASSTYTGNAEGVYVGYGTETLQEWLEDVSNSGIMDAISVTDEGGLNVSWSVGELFDQVNQAIIDTNASTSDELTDGAVNYLKWVSGADLTLSTTDAEGNERSIAHFAAQDNEIWEKHEEPDIANRESSIEDALEKNFPTTVSSGIIVSEDADATNAFDISVSAGVYYHDMQEKHDWDATTTLTGIMQRWFHSGGNWTHDTDQEIDVLQYDDGADLDNIGNNQYTKSCWLASQINGTEVIHWIYPTEQFANLASALVAPCPTKPPGLERQPYLTAVVMRQGDTAFPTAGGSRWIDVRPTVTSAPAGNVTDHGSLSGLADGCDDHTTLGCLAEDESASGGWNFTTDLRVTGILHGSSTDFDFLTVNGDGLITGNATTTGSLNIGDRLSVTGNALISGNSTTTKTFEIGGDGELVVDGERFSNLVAATTTLDFWFDNTAGITGNSNIVTVGTLTTGATGAGFTVDLDASTLTCTNCIDISANTNLAVSSPIVLTDDTLSFDFTTANTWSGINTFSSDLRATGGLHATTTDFDALVVNGDGLITGNATTTGAHSVGKLSVNNTYWFPEVAGGNNEILKTDANGIVTWQADTGGGGSSNWLTSVDETYLYPSTTKGILVSASSTFSGNLNIIGNTTSTNATTTGSLYITDQLTVATLTDHAVIVGSGATALTPLAVGSNGQLLVGSTGADPVFATFNCDDDLTCTTGAGTLEIDVDDSFLRNDAVDTTAFGITFGSASTTDSMYVGGLLDVTGNTSLANGTSTGWFYIEEDLTVNGTINGDLAGTVTGDLVCTDCLNATEIEDIYLLNNANDTTAFGITMGSATTTDSMYVGGLLDVTGDTSMVNATTTGSLYVTKDGNVALNFIVSGNSTTTGVMVVGGDSNATSTLELGSDTQSSTGGCLKVMDFDGGGWSYGRTLDGSITWSTQSCE